MNQWCKRLGALVAAASLSAFLMLAGCEGTESRSQVDDTVEELSGKKQVDRMKAMREDLEHIQTQQAGRTEQLENSD
jgi:outer membrane murein-binding lipoprotein Lpp